MTVDEILAAGQYKSRAWGLIERCREACPGNGLWVCAGHYEPWEHLRTDQVKLMIERDLHRGECVGLPMCTSHPVPIVIVALDPPGNWHRFKIRYKGAATMRESLTEAMDAARALAVGE